MSDIGEDVVRDVLATAEAEARSSHDVFAERVLNDLEVAGTVEEWQIAYYRGHGLEVSGFGGNESLDSIDLFLASFSENPSQGKLGKAELQAQTKRALNFLRRASEGLADELEEASEAYDMCRWIEENLGSATAIRIFVITNKASTTRRLEQGEFAGRPVSFEIWDSSRLERLSTSGVLHEPIVVAFDPPLSCLATPTTDGDYSVFLSILPGPTLAKVYADYGSRLLELNVRSFLQARGNVNRGIRETLNYTPERFLAYNNGISATASKVDFDRASDGALRIRRIHELQVVNGGQTTASIHSAVIKDGVDVSKVMVQMKLTVVSPDRIGDIVPEISRFSNTQNKVTVVDFSSNDALHVELEKVSRTLWAPAEEGSGQETKWFYERARGQYADALARERTPARKRAFKLIHPTKQKFTKTDVAKWENAWAQRPHVVSLGGEKNFRQFMLTMEGKAPTKDIEYVQRLIAKGILFKSAERIVSAQNYGGYRANIVAYSIAKLSFETAQRLNLDRIWREQRISDATADALADLSKIVHDIIMAPVGTVHVGEWTKKEVVWKRVTDVRWEVPATLQKELISTAKAKSASVSDYAAGLTEKDKDNLRTVLSVPVATWPALVMWAKETGNLSATDRNVALQLGKKIQRVKEPTPREAADGARILGEVTALGFRP